MIATRTFRSWLACLIFGLTLFPLAAQDLQSPSEYLGYSLGTRFSQHHQVSDYFHYVARTYPDRVRLQQYGTTNEGRPLLLATLSSPENIENLEDLRKTHLEGLEGRGAATTAIVWLSYNVHGNESVSTEAAMETLYRLLTDKSDLLERTVVLIDPCINPDGRERYVNWYKQRRNNPNQPDPNSLEHHEGWLSGRGNHYMFDLNRDWAWLTQTESRQRLLHYNKWMPHIHVDFHEQGVDAPYYFAPAAEPYHEVITDFQREFQKTIGRNHAKYFDAAGWFYFTREVFDLFYPSYGDTYPTYNGAIGMTYEQGGSGRAGLAVVTGTGDTLTLRERIDHHLTTGLSTVEVAASHGPELNDEFRKFHRRVADFEHQSYVLNGNKDHLQALAELLDHHEIAYGYGQKGTARGFRYDTQARGSLPVSQESLVIPVTQPRGTLVKVLFEPNAKLTDSLTYDITAWSLPYAYGLQALASESAVPFTRKPVQGQAQKQEPRTAAEAYAYLTDWDSMEDARFLAEIIQEGIRVRRAAEPFVLDGHNWGRGTLIITRSDNAAHQNLGRFLSEKAHAYGKELTPTDTGRVDSGKDFGSRSVEMIAQPRVAVLSGEPTSTLRFGEVWHFFEKQLNYPLTVLGSDYYDEVDLSLYNVLILPDGGGYETFLDRERLNALQEWIRAGGRLIAMGESLDALQGVEGFGIARKEVPDVAPDPLISHASGRRERMRNRITGAIFKTRIDPTHPLAFGYSDSYYSLKRNDASFDFLQEGDNVSVLQDDPRPVAGFAGSLALQQIPNSLIFGVEEYGDGSVVYLVDNPLFRGFWESGKLFFANALFMLE